MNALLALALSCYGLPPDSQAYCQARQMQNPGYCYSITNPDMRAQCRAEVSQGVSACGAIPDLIKRQECLNRAKY